MSPEVVDRGHLSIGEVLSLLREEFPDVTISKIRFLESQGLLEPERTPSGYRKFYDADVERLRWILRQQREHFLPLKVIRGRLTGDPAAEEAERATDSGGSIDPTPADAPVPEAEEPAPAAATARAAPAAPRRASRSAATQDSLLEPPQDAPPRWTGATGATLTLPELANACGLTIGQVQELERFGLISGRAMAGTVYYDEETLLVANLAAAFLRYGVEARHLRLYKNAAEREAGFIEQVVTPLLKQRNPRSRHQAMDTIAELSHLGHELRAALLRQALHDLTGP
jgi:DNA-binding transcriptional MerR regulator